MKVAYGRDEIRHLQQIRSLRQLGFSLEEIRESLDGRGYTLERIVDLHIAALDEQIEQQRDRRRVLSDDRIQEAQADWRQLFEKFGSAMEAGIDPAGDPVQTLAAL